MEDVNLELVNFSANLKPSNVDKSTHDVVWNYCPQNYLIMCKLFYKNIIHVLSLMSAYSETYQSSWSCLASR